MFQQVRDAFRKMHRAQTPAIRLAAYAGLCIVLE
jgi:hypothetical protein